MQIYECASLSSVSLVKLPHHEEDNGQLVVIEGLVNIPFAIARVFLVLASKGAIRGMHAHKACTQFLTCPRGAVKVMCTDGVDSLFFELNHPNLGLYIPPGLWSEQTYMTADGVLMVSCDRIYEPEDYIRDYDDFLSHRHQSLKLGKNLKGDLL